MSCSTDAEIMQKISLIVVEWKILRESFSSSPNFLIIVTSSHKTKVSQVLVGWVKWIRVRMTPLQRTDLLMLPSFLRTAVKSLHHCQINPITESVRRVNATNLAQNTTNNALTIPYPSDGRIGAVLVTTMKTKKGSEWQFWTTAKSCVNASMVSFCAIGSGNLIHGVFHITNASIAITLASTWDTPHLSHPSRQQDPQLFKVTIHLNEAWIHCLNFHYPLPSSPL